VRAKRRLLARLGLLGAGAIAGLVIAEVALNALGLPRFYAARKVEKQFRLVARLPSGEALWANLPSARIRFEYDGDPRGYFEAGASLVHETNSSGFRGPEFFPLPPGLHLVFLGDSFTFGEGVRLPDTYPERTAHLVEERSGVPARAFNLGVGGHNTTLSRHLLESIGVALQPDVVVLGYALNDAEPPLYVIDEERGEIHRRPREAVIPEGLAQLAPPDRWLYRLRTARAVFLLLESRERTRRTLAYYRSLYDGPGAGFEESHRALEQIAAVCRARGVPFVVLLFPVLFDLDDYPFRDVHERVRRAVEQAGGVFVDLLPRLAGEKAAQLWVHPTDQHPNERVHAIAARALSEEILKLGLRPRQREELPAPIANR
jgi:hypothetical protein